MSEQADGKNGTPYYQPDSMGEDFDRRPDLQINQRDSLAYWSGCEASVGAMLGGLTGLSERDLAGSREFLAQLGVGRFRRVLEGGCGIGRVTLGLLLTVAEVVDVIEPVAKFTAQLQGQAGVGTIFTTGLEGWAPGPGQAGYDLVWAQWCVGHLRDDQLVAFLRRCRAGLAADGPELVVIKENVTGGPADVFDVLDSSVTRRDDKFRLLFANAGFRVVRTNLEIHPEQDLFPVRLYALKPL